MSQSGRASHAGTATSCHSGGRKVARTPFVNGCFGPSQRLRLFGWVGFAMVGANVVVVVEVVGSMVVVVVVDGEAPVVVVVEGSVTVVVVVGGGLTVVVVVVVVVGVPLHVVMLPSLSPSRYSWQYSAAPIVLGFPEVHDEMRLGSHEYVVHDHPTYPMSTLSLASAWSIDDRNGLRLFAEHLKSPTSSMRTGVTAATCTMALPSGLGHAVVTLVVTEQGELPLGKYVCTDAAS